MCFVLKSIVILFIASGDIKDPNDLVKFLVRNDDNVPTCGICFKFSNKTSTCVKNHIEAIHFPNLFIYSCPYCRQEFNSKKALYNHKRRQCTQNLM